MAAEVSPEDKKYIQTLLAQRKEEQFYLGTVQKGDKKKDAKVVLVTQHRVYVIKAGEHKIYKDANLLDLVEIRSPNNSEIALIFKSFEVDGSIPRADDIITNIRQAYEFSFYGTPEESRIKLNVQPSSRIMDLAAKELPLGGFVNTYKAVCDYFSHPPREEICWDMEHTYSTKNIKTFDLSEFEQPLHPHDIRALLTSLRYNTHFTSLVICDIPFNKDQVTVLADTLKTNSAIEVLKLVNIGARAEAVTTICAALSANKNIAVTELDISNNPIEDKGIIAVANFIGSTPRGIVRLDISHTSLSKAGTSAIGSALKKNVKTSATLFYLALDGNKLEAEGSSALASYLATPNSLRSLHIASTIPSLETIIGAVVRGCPELRHINVSDNKMTKKDATLLTRFISASASLKQLTLNRTAIPADALKEILVSIGGNVYLQDFILEAKGNELGLVGAQAIADAAPRLSNVHTLDLDENDFGDDGISAVAEGLCNNSYVKRLDISRNYKVVKSKPRGAMLESLTNLLSSDCPLEALILAGGPKSQLKGELVSLIYDLATNDSLLELDVSGQSMGNRGAVALGKTLQTNNTLTTLTWDDNQTTLPGFQSFRTGMERNHSLKVMALPILDIAAAIRSDPPHKVQQVIADIEKALSRNQSPGRQFEAHKNTALGSFSVLTSGQQQNIDKLVMKIKSTGHKVEEQDDLNVIQDAGSTEKFVAAVHLMREATYQLAEEEMQSRLKAFAEQASTVLRQKKGELVSQILKALQGSFSSMDQQTLRRLHTGIEFGSKDLDQAELETILVKATGAELSSKANETFLSCVEIASDYVYEKMESRLNEIYQELETQRPSGTDSGYRNSPHTSQSYIDTQGLSSTPPVESGISTPPASPAPSRPPPSNPPPSTPPPSVPQPSTPPPTHAPPSVPSAGTSAPPPARAAPPKPAPRVLGTPSAPPSATGSPSVQGRVAAVSGNAAVAAAIARGVGGPPSPALRPVRPPRESTIITQQQMEREDSKGEIEAPLSPKKDEPPAVLKKEDSKVSKEDLKKEKEKKEKEEKERKEREKKEKEEKEKKEKERAKAEKEKKEKEKKDKDKNAKVVKAGGAKAPVKAGATATGAVDIPVQEKPKEQELVHLTRERPKGPGGGRKPPTRRPRPPTAEESS